MHKRRIQRAFTLVELLVTIGLVMILMSITLVSLNIDKQFKSAREAKRSSDIRVVLESVSQLLIDEKEKATIPNDGISRYLSNGVYRSKWSSEDTPVPTPNSNLCTLLVPRYVAQMPLDPLFDITGSGGTSDCSNYHTGYMLTRTPEGRLIVSAPFSELRPIIVVR